MSLRTPPLPTDIQSLTRLVLALRARNDELQGRIDLLERQLYGAKSEKIATVDPTQGILDLGDLSAVPAFRWPPMTIWPPMKFAHGRRAIRLVATSAPCHGICRAANG